MRDARADLLTYPAQLFHSCLLGHGGLDNDPVHLVQACKTRLPTPAPSIKHQSCSHTLRCLITEHASCMQAGRREVILDALPGFPDGVSRSADGKSFWVGVVTPPSLMSKAMPYR